MSHNNVSPSILQGAADIQAILNHSRHWAAIRERDRLTVEYEDKLRKAEEQTRAVMHELATTKELEEAHKKQIAIMEELAQVQKQKLVELEERSKAHKKEVSELSDLNQALKKELVETEERARSQNEKIEAQAKQLADAHAQLASLAPQLDALKSQEASTADAKLSTTLQGEVPGPDFSRIASPITEMTSQWEVHLATDTPMTMQVDCTTPPHFPPEMVDGEAPNHNGLGDEDTFQSSSSRCHVPASPEYNTVPSPSPSAERQSSSADTLIALPQSPRSPICTLGHITGCGCSSASNLIPSDLHAISRSASPSPTSRWRKWVSPQVKQLKHPQLNRSKNRSTTVCYIYPGATEDEDRYEILER